MTLHKDVIGAVIQYYVDRVENGDELTFDEYSESLNFLIQHLMIKQNELLERVIDKQETIRIYDLFLANHGLTDEFDTFYNRILERKFRRKGR